MGADAEPEKDDPAREEHAVLVHIAMSDEWGSPRDRMRLWRLERQLEKAVERAQAGEFDGNEFGEGEAVFYMYGPDKDRLWRAVEPVLRKSSMRPAYALVRAGRRQSAPTPS